VVARLLWLRGMRTFLDCGAKCGNPFVLFTTTHPHVLESRIIKVAKGPTRRFHGCWVRSSDNKRWLRSLGRTQESLSCVPSPDPLRHRVIGVAPTRRHLEVLDAYGRLADNAPASLKRVGHLLHVALT